jgi:hypothetical protein
VSAGKNTATCREHTAICSMLLASASNRLMRLVVLLALARSKAQVSLKCRGPYAKMDAQPYRIVSKLRQGDVRLRKANLSQRSREPLLSQCGATPGGAASTEAFALISRHCCCHQAMLFIV